MTHNEPSYVVPGLSEAEGRTLDQDQTFTR